MKRTTKYVGLDVHQSTTVAVVGDDTGRVIARTILATEEAALLEFFRGLRGAVYVALEEGTQAHWLCDLLTPVVARVVIADRRGRVAGGKKGDLHDAAQLAEALRCGTLRAVYHGSPDRARLKEVARTYTTLVDDATRVMLRLKALFRARGIPTRGRRVYQAAERAEWLAKLSAPGARFRADVLYEQLDGLLTRRPTVKHALVVEAKRDPAWARLRTIPFLGPVRVALLVATLQTPWRFRTKRHLWAYAGLAVVTQTTAEYEWPADGGGRPVRRRRAPMTRGLNRNHNRVVKAVVKAAATAAAARPGPLQEFYQARVAGGMRPELARLTVARKLAAVLLHVWKTGERYDPAKLTARAG
jgi:transposase